MYKYSGKKIEYIWCIDNRKSFPGCFKNIKLVKFHSFLYHYYILTSKVYFGNAGISVYLPIRKEQIVVNTWHGGGAYKKVGIADIKKDKTYTKFALNIATKELTYFISSCTRFSEVMGSDRFVNGKKFLSFGMPRNDIFFSPAKLQEIKAKVLDDLQINKDICVLLYAPTYRESIDNVVHSAGIDIPMILEVLGKRFYKRFVCLYRRHPFFLHKSNIADNQNVIDVSLWPDMQELLCASDVLITDYSSSIWDFSLTGKPCFLYMPDSDEYKTERGFYIPFDKLPFPCGRTNDELAKAILSFDARAYKNAIKEHHEDLGSYEKGNACEKMYELIKGVL
jgi:CDP-glycerol glycerophosphotransferase